MGETTRQELRVKYCISAHAHARETKCPISMKFWEIATLNEVHAPSMVPPPAHANDVQNSESY